MPSIFTVKARRQPRHSHAPWAEPSRLALEGPEVLLAAVGAVEGDGALGHDATAAGLGVELVETLAAQEVLVGAGHPGRERLVGVAVGQEVGDHGR